MPLLGIVGCFSLLVYCPICVHAPACFISPLLAFTFYKYCHGRGGRVPFMVCIVAIHELYCFSACIQFVRTSVSFEVNSKIPGS